VDRGWQGGKYFLLKLKFLEREKEGNANSCSEKRGVVGKALTGFASKGRTGYKCEKMERGTFLP